MNPRGIDPTTWGFEDQNGRPVAVSPAPTTNVYHGTVQKDGETFYYRGGTGPYASEPYKRRCWNHSFDGTPYNISGTATYDASRRPQKQDPAPDSHFGPQGDVRYFEGDIATHGLHLLLTSDSANASLTVPVDEIDSVDYQAILPPDEPNVGAAYSQQFLTPIQAVATPLPSTQIAVPQPYVAGSGAPQSPLSGPAGTGSSNPVASDSPSPVGSSAASSPSLPGTAPPLPPARDPGATGAPGPTQRPAEPPGDTEPSSSGGVLGELHDHGSGIS